VGSNTEPDHHRFLRTAMVRVRPACVLPRLVLRGGGQQRPAKSVGIHCELW